MKIFFFLLLGYTMSVSLLEEVRGAGVGGCNRKPQGASGDRSPVDDKFQILIDGNPATYFPGQQYNISLSCASGLKFISFTMVLESEDPALGVVGSAGADMYGHFELLDMAESKFSAQCENMLESTNSNPKGRIDVTWVAPTNPQSGCVLIRAAVVQHRNVWYIDDGFLTKRICPEEIDEINSQTPPLETCCACDEAKYEMILERKWSRNTHSKDFPIAAWRTRLSEIIGASHTTDYRVWEYGTLASAGLREMAEHGSTATLEAEIKDSLSTGKIRTIIKAPGIVYRQNNLGSTMANVRVDSTHHIVSLVSKIEPSPDWILGVAGLELCLANCTWIERKELNLYPWDIGTDAGPSYMSPDQPQIPPDVIRRITSTFPSDHRSPFYDESGAPIKPLATLHIKKKKIYERECSEDNSMNENQPLECATHPWNSFSECSAKCGQGVQYRVRYYKDPEVAANFGCNLEMRQDQNCFGPQCGSNGEGSDFGRMGGASEAECEVTPWSEWSECSMKCGNGFTKRTRYFLHPMAKSKCQSGGVPIELEQRKECYGEDCGGQIQSNYDNDNEMPSPFDDVLERVEDKPKLFHQNSRIYGNSNRRLEEDSLNVGGNIDEGPYRNQGDQEEEERPDLRRPQTQFPGENSIYGSEKFTGRRPFTDDENRGPHRGSSNQLKLPGRYRQQGPDIESEYPESDSRSSLGNRGQGIPRRRPFGRPAPEEDPSNNRYSTPFGRLPQPPEEEPGQRFGSNQFSQPSYGSPNNFAGRQKFPMYRPGERRPQDFCFEKPVADDEPCNKAKVTVRNYWFYDADDRQCKIFTADNCDRNKNKFRTLKACDATCQVEDPNGLQEEEPDYGNANSFKRSWRRK